MKLGATITSERGKRINKTANGFLQIELRNEQSRLLGVIEIRPAEKESVKVELRLAPDVELITNGSLKHGKCEHLHKIRYGNPKTEYWGYKCKDCGMTQ